MAREVQVLNLGAGVQSTTLYLMFMRGLVTPQIEAAIFADTQDEPEAVYAHLDWLRSLGGPPILTRTVGCLGDDLVNGRNSTGQRFASIPAFTTPDGGESVGITRRQCSKEYKTEVIAKTIRRDVLGLKPRQRVPKAIRIVQNIGFSLDEGGRAMRLRDLFKKEHKWATPRFPLIDLHMTRSDCVWWLKKYANAPHEVPRSSCVFCPYHTDEEWLRVKANENDWARAVKVDESLRANGSIINRDMRQTLYLHDSCRPLSEVEFKPETRKQIPMSFYRECEGVCGN